MNDPDAYLYVWVNWGGQWHLGTLIHRRLGGYVVGIGPYVDWYAEARTVEEHRDIVAANSALLS